MASLVIDIFYRISCDHLLTSLYSNWSWDYQMKAHCSKIIFCREKFVARNFYTICESKNDFVIRWPILTVGYIVLTCGWCHAKRSLMFWVGVIPKEGWAFSKLKKYFELFPPLQTTKGPFCITQLMCPDAVYIISPTSSILYKIFTDRKAWR